MTALPSFDDAPPPASTAAAACALIEGQIALLSRLAHVGLEIAEACGREAKAGPAASPQAARDPGLAFARVARAVRMTIALQSRLAKDLAALDQADQLGRRLRLSRLVEQAAEAQITARRQAAPSPVAPWDEARQWSDDRAQDEIEALADETYERLTDAEDAPLADRPFAEVVAEICGDLGLSPDWTGRLLAATAHPSQQAAGTGPAAYAPPPIQSPPSSVLAPSAKLGPQFRPSAAAQGP